VLHISSASKIYCQNFKLHSVFPAGLWLPQTEGLKHSLPYYTDKVTTAPYTPPSLCDTIYVEDLLFETNSFWVWKWHGFATPQHSDSSNLIINFNIFAGKSFISVSFTSPCFNNYSHICISFVAVITSCPKLY